jgi:hypothetical protein
MTPRDFCTTRDYEAVKGAVHGAMLLGAVCCLAYNVASFWYRRETHNAVNAVIYGTLTALEIQHIKHHLEKP